MKKVFSIIAVAALATSFVACGPSADEKAKMEAEAQRKADSARVADSLAAAATMEATVEMAKNIVRQHLDEGYWYYEPKLITDKLEKERSNATLSWKLQKITSSYR